MATSATQFHLFRARKIISIFEILYIENKTEGIKYLLKKLSKQPDKIKYMVIDGVITRHPELEIIRNEL